MSMMEEYITFVLDRMRGASDADRPQDAGNHPHRLKWRAISAVLASHIRLAGLYMTLDLWEFYGERHEFCKSKSKYGSFASGHHRHEMAVRVCKDIVWYEAALKDPAAVFKQTEAFMQGGRRRRFADRIVTDVRQYGVVALGLDTSVFLYNFTMLPYCKCYQTSPSAAGDGRT